MHSLPIVSETILKSLSFNAIFTQYFNNFTEIIIKQILSLSYSTFYRWTSDDLNL